MIEKVRVRRVRPAGGQPALPEYQTAGSSGLDLRADLTEERVIEPMGRAAIPTGIALEIPLGLEGQVRPRSGLALRKGITCLNSPGTIDSDFRGEVQVILANLSTEPFVVRPGDRIAQLVFAAVQRVELVEVSDLSPTSRGVGGFGSTGE